MIPQKKQCPNTYNRNGLYPYGDYVGTPSDSPLDPVKSDAVNPDHYKVGGIETIDYLRAKLSPEEFAGYCRGNALKYLSRAGHKDDAAQDLAKARWYLDRMLEAWDARA